MKKAQNPIVTVFFLLFTSFHAFSQNTGFCGGTILAYITKDSAVIVSDTKLVKGVLGGEKSFTTTSKLRYHNLTHYAIAGSARIYYNNIVLFDAFEIMKKAIGNRYDFKAIAETFLTLTNEALSDLVKRGMSKSKMLKLFESGILMDVIMVRYYGTASEYFQFSLQQIGKELKCSINFSEVSNQRPILVCVGTKDHIQSYLNKKDYLKLPTNLKDQLLNLERKEITSHSTEMGCPIEVATITATKWYSKYIDDCNNRL